MNTTSKGQVSCKNFDNDDCKKACELANLAEPYQGYKQSQMAFDKAIELCPNFDYAYREKSVPYLKRGDFITWKKLIDKAVTLNPNNNLGYRGWCQYQFLRNYKAAINDIELLEKLVGNDNVGFSQNGDYSLQVVKALCYKGLGNNKKAIEILEKQIHKKNYTRMFYDYYHLGILYFQEEKLEKAKIIFQKQILKDDYFAEPYYYLSLIFFKQEKTKKAKEYIIKALDYYNNNKIIKDRYTTNIDKIYKQDIITLQTKINNSTN
ncbi:hypothetical protein KB553_10020 [Chryseobacterium rhizoplanae]|uniref:tetratricopeptide repeat protein n=1 Tax=Chryseobacterium rhizoplanae TaxID=1609531 RepID=UPI001CE2F1AE|nr:hypothetical protein [Chryseobacterium rhizoplanae]UCA61834.1 hypothetical protein KB553_10020 [Chryseobacterium rhizoplanae]